MIVVGGNEVDARDCVALRLEERRHVFLYEGELTELYPHKFLDVILVTDIDDVLVRLMLFDELIHLLINILVLLLELSMDFLFSR